MLSLDDPRWSTLEGGYRVPHDPRPVLARLRAGTDDEAAWDELWNELHHQDDVGTASYAAVPHLIDIHRARSLDTWQTYALVGTIELCRTGANPPLPDWLAPEYHDALRTFAQRGLDQLAHTTDPLVERGVLGLVALVRGHRNLARAALDFTDDELTAMFG